mgnify:CR=1 FL=1
MVMNAVCSQPLVRCWMRFITPDGDNRRETNKTIQSSHDCKFDEWVIQQKDN